MGKETRDIHILIITGLSGAGKSQAINCLEDMGYYCVDNLPPALLNKFVELSLQSEGKIEKWSIDVGEGNSLTTFPKLCRKQEGHMPLRFFRSSMRLVRRSKNPAASLAEKRSLLEAIQLERDMLKELRGQANVL